MKKKERQLQTLMTSLGFSNEERRGAAFLAGMCTAMSESPALLIQKIALFSSKKPISDLQDSFGDVRDLQIAHDIEDFLALIGDTYEYGPILYGEVSVPLYQPKISRRLRSNEFKQNIWDTQLLYSQLCSSIATHLGADDQSLECAFDNGFFYHAFHHQADIRGAANVLSLILEMSPPIYKGIWCLHAFERDQLAMVTNYHVCLLGFGMGLGPKIEELLWAALSFVLYEPGGSISRGVLESDPATYHSYCVSGIRKFIDLQPKNAQILVDGLGGTRLDNSNILASYVAMAEYLVAGWPGFTDLMSSRPEQFQLIYRTLIFFESVKATVRQK